MKSRWKAVWPLAGLGIFMLVAAGCNDTLRQFIVPVPGPSGDPGTLAHAITLSTNPAPLSDGSDMHIDVSGDTSAGIVPLGPNPVFLGKAGNRVFAINGGDATTPPTVSVYIALLPQSATVSTVTLLLPLLTTKILLLAVLPAIATGLVPTGIVAVTASTPPDITLTLLLPLLAM